MKKMQQDFMKTKPILPLVLSMSLPMMLSMLVNSLYNIIDSMFVAKLGEDALTAVSLIYPLQTLVTSVGVGFGVGINAIAAFFLGAGEKDKADMATTQGILLSIVHGLLLTLITCLTLPGFLHLFTQDAQIYEWGLQYGYLVLSFAVISTLQIAIEKVFQAVGSMKVPMLCMTAGCVANIVLDPLFIFGIGFFPRMEIKGAAVATVIGQVVTLVLYLVIWVRKDIGLHFSRKYAKLDSFILGRLYQIGIPSSLNMGLPSLLITILNGIAALYAPIYILILGVYFKLQTFLYLPANGIVQGMRPIVSYNYGAGEEKRMKKIIGLCSVLILAILCAGMLLFLLIPGLFMELFTGDALTITEGSKALRIISLGFVVSGISVVASGTLEALGKGGLSFLISLLRNLAVIVPAALLGSYFFGITGIWSAFPIAEVITAVVAGVILRSILFHKQKNE